MNKTSKISEAELEVMKILWNTDQPVSTKYIYKQLQEQMGWNRSTVRTLIKRLHEKEAIIQKNWMCTAIYLPFRKRII